MEAYLTKLTMKTQNLQHQEEFLQARCSYLCGLLQGEDAVLNSLTKEEKDTLRSTINSIIYKLILRYTT